MEQQHFEDSRRVKHEPPVEFVLILPRPTHGWPAIKQEKDVKPKLVPTVKLTKFDAKWPHDSELFQTFFTCPHCQLVVNHQRHFTRHLRTCIKINPARFECDFCEKGFQMKSSIRKHMLKHSSETKFCCDKCSYQTKNGQSLKKHKRTHNKSIECDTCHKKFAENNSLKDHQMQHRHGIYATALEETFDCDKCDKSFSTPNYLRMHQRNVHDKKEAKCDVCKKICSNRYSLRQHSQIHEKVECTFCHKMFPKPSMASHLRSHSARNIFKCDLCDHSTNTKGNLKDHIERMHLLKKLVNDSKCREDFSEFELLEKLQLKWGSSATSGEKKFKCDKCTKGFVTPRRLNEHKRTVHTEKLFDCHDCKKVYKARSYLNRHRAKAHSKN